jgi:hypothetical protein
VVDDVTGDLVTFTTSYQRADWDAPELSESTIRFIDHQLLNSLLNEAGLTITAQFGDWDRGPVGPTSPEIITLAHRA